MELWSQQHAQTLLPAVAVMLLLSLVLRKAIGHKSFEIRMIPMKIIAVLLVLLEIGKQAVSFSRGYDLYHIPLHFCSLFIFVLPVMAFYRGKGQQMVFGVAAALSVSVFSLMLIYPCLIYSAGNIENFFAGYLDFHTVAFHNLVMLAFLLIVALELHTPAPKGESKVVVLFMVGFSVVAASMAQILKTNFANFYSCNIPVLEAVRMQVQAVLGPVITQLIYVVLVALLQTLYVLGFYRLYRLLAKAVQKKKLQQV